jgi:hypothetical protein
MKDILKLKELVIEQVPLAEVMLSYGVRFQLDPRIANEVQFQCHFHGKDTKPSARLYNSTKTCFCWVCRKTWNVISFTMDAERFTYKQAIKYLINKYHIDTSSIPDEPVFEFPKIQISETRIALNLIEKHILELRRKIKFEQYRNFCVALYLLKYQDFQGFKILDGITKIQNKINEVKGTLAL